jgi:hypothetical protein
MLLEFPIKTSPTSTSRLQVLGLALWFLLAA